MNKAVLIISMIMFSAPAMAINCPVSFGTDNYIEQVTNKIDATKTCYDAGQLAEACGMGSSGDVPIAGAAQEVCAKDFDSKLSAQDRTTYKGLQEKCNAKYEKMQGTMYIGANAFCHLQVAELFSELFTPAE